jgi:hypothetical protein
MTPTSCGESTSPLALQLAQETPIDPDLAAILDAWPTLPEPIRRAMLALVGTAKGP